MPVKKEDLPATIKRSSKEARETYSKAIDSAHEQYDSEERAHRTAIAALKHKFEKVGDRWVKKEKKGPSDERAATGKGETAGGVDVNGNTKKELYEQIGRASCRERVQ